MKTIHKFPFAIKDEVMLQIPGGAKILTCQTQGEIPCVWAMVDTEVKLVDRKFRVFGTGHPIKFQGNLEYIGTFQIDGGALISHLFEIWV